MDPEHATWLRWLIRQAERRGTDAELGDVLEEYATGARSRAWVFRQLVSIVARRRPRRRGPEPRRSPTLSDVRGDVRYAVRMLRRHPGFTLAAIVPIALGVGINTGVFTILESVALRPLPVPDATELVSIAQEIHPVRRYIAGAPSMVSMPEYERYRDGARMLSGLAAYSRPLDVTLGGDVPREIIGRAVTCNFFDVLKVTPVLGPGFTAATCDGPGGTPTVILSHDLWTSTFGRRTDIVGETISLNRQAFVVAGVGPPGFAGVDIIKTAFFAPASTIGVLSPNQPGYHAENASWLSLIGRRNRGVSTDAVRSELAVVARQLDRDQPDRVKPDQPDRASTVSVQAATLLPLPEVRREIAGVATIVLAAFGLVLVMACANVANLLLARTAGRSREIAVRLAAGASRARLVQQLLTESLILALLGGLAGVLLAWWSVQGLVAIVLSSLPTGGEALAIAARPNLTVLWFALGLTIATGVLFGLAPAWQASGSDVHAGIKQATGGSTRRPGWLRGTLTAVQVAVCMTLLISAGLLLRALTAAQTIEPGFAYHDVSVLSFDLPGSGYDQQKASVFQESAMNRLRAVPGVVSVAQVQKTPLSPGRMGFTVRLPSQEQWEFFDFNVVSPEYFSLLDIPIVRGRSFTPLDLVDGSPAAIVTEATARRLWPDVDAVGQTLVMGAGPGVEVPLQIVGVTSDAQVQRMAQTEPSYLYLPATPPTQAGLTLLVRSEAAFATVAPALRAAMQQLDPALAVTLRRLEDNLNLWRTMSRLVAGLSGALGLLALALASVGVYGVVAYVVSRRVREIAIRMALGATTAGVQRMLLRQTMAPVLTGMAVGVAAAATISRFLEGVLFGVSPLDTASFAGAVLFLTAIAAAASLVPARRALRVDPLMTLRAE